MLRFAHAQRKIEKKYTKQSKLAIFIIHEQLTCMSTTMTHCKYGKIRRR